MRVYATPTSGQAAASAPAYVSSTPTYQPYIRDQGNPYTYREHYDSFFGPVEPRTPDQEITATERTALVKPAARMAPP